jgi:hypothetical protein
MQRREQILKAFGANESVTQELLEYNSNVYDHSAYTKMVFPLEDEGFVSVWEGYERESEERGVHETLKEKLVQLNFTVERGTSSAEYYRAATLRGEPVQSIPEATGLKLAQKEKLELFLAASPAGRLPVILIHNRSDFIALVRALAFKNEPEEVPDSMGSLVVAGYNNWDRLRSYRERWEQANPGGNWQEEFKRIAAQKELYQDKFMILSNNPYSGVRAAKLAVNEEQWKELSFKIRLGHELCHYFCRRVLLVMRSNAFDELLADYCGIVYATGCYRSDWLLCFMGLEQLPVYRDGGRLQNYTAKLSQGAFAVLCSLVKAASANLEKLDVKVDRAADESYKVLTALSYFTLEELAADDAVRALRKRYEEVQRNWRIRS